MAYRKFIALEICSTIAQQTIIRKHITVCFLKDEYVRLFLMEKIKVRNAFVNDAGLIKTCSQPKKCRNLSKWLLLKTIHLMNSPLYRNVNKRNE